MNSQKLTLADYLKIKKVEDINVSKRYIVWVEKTPNSVKRDFDKHLMLYDKETRRIRKFSAGIGKDYFPRFSPDGSRLAFISTREGKPQLFLLNLLSGEARRIINSKYEISWFEWSPDSTKIGFLSYINLRELEKTDNNRHLTTYEIDIQQSLEKEKIKKERDPRVITKLVYRTGTKYKNEDKNFHIFVVDVISGNTHRVTDGDYRYSEFTWINNDEILCLARREEPVDLSMTYSVVRFDVFKTSLGDEITSVYNRSIDRRLPGPSAYPNGPILIPKLEEPELFGKILKWGLLQTNGDCPSINTGLDRNISTIKWMSDTQAIVSIENEGKTELRAFDVVTMKFEIIFSHSASIESFDCDDLDEIYFIGTEPSHPSAIWKWDGKEVQLLYDPNEDFLQSKQIVEPREIWLENPEGSKYHGWFFKARSDNGKKSPLILSIHGGPDFMWNNAGSMWFEWQCSLSRGYSILAMNPIGSGGYGEKFAAEIKSSWGINDARDLLAAVDSIIDEVDAERLYITGGSYAGFQTVNIISRDNRFRAACAQRGVYNLLTFGMVTDIPVWSIHAWEGSVWEEGQLEKLWKHSPVARAPKVNTPVLIIHSENDFRVGISQAEEMFSALKLHKKEAVFVRYPRDGHDLSREGEPIHIIDRLERILQWFDNH